MTNNRIITGLEGALTAGVPNTDFKNNRGSFLNGIVTEVAQKSDVKDSVSKSEDATNDLKNRTAKISVVNKEIREFRAALDLDVSKFPLISQQELTALTQNLAAANIHNKVAMENAMALFVNRMNQATRVSPTPTIDAEFAVKQLQLAAKSLSQPSKEPKLPNQKMKEELNNIFQKSMNWVSDYLPREDYLNLQRKFGQILKQVEVTFANKPFDQTLVDGFRTAMLGRDVVTLNDRLTPTMTLHEFYKASHKVKMGETQKAGFIDNQLTWLAGQVMSK